MKSKAANPRPAKFRVELTDLAQGQPNYAFIQRAEIEVPDSAPALEIVQAAKRALGIRPDAKSRNSKIRDSIEIRFPGAALIAFVDYIG